MVCKWIFFFIVALSFLTAKAQYPLPDPAGQGSYTNFVQPPPTAASLGKYADFPVSYFTGVPNISIPIYDLKDGDAELLISLSYHASGIRVSEVASWVGLGWALNAGGVIIRTVRGTADEGSYSQQGDGAGSSPPAPRGYYSDLGLYNFPKLPYADANGNPQSYNGSGLPLTHYAAAGLGSGTVDGESDLYIFNFNGHMGKFLFDENQTPHLLKDDNLKIKVIYNLTDFVSWIITDEKGIQYIFGQNQNGNNYEKAWPSQGPQSLAGPGPISSWFLNQIIYPNNNDTVNFTYTSEYYFYADIGGESESMSFETLPGGGSPQPTLICDNTHNNVSGRSNPPNPNLTTCNGVRLTGISSKNIKIVFEADNARLDLNSQVSELDKIIISYKTGQCIKQFKFSYGYFASPFSNIWSGLTYSNLLCDSLRLKLLSLDELSCDNSIVKPPYVFTYQDGFPLPRRLSFDQDHWGFSNNSGNPVNSYLTPGGVWLSSICSTSFGANREPSWPQMSAGTLLSIKDPLGATTTFQYEANQIAIPLITGNSMVGGLRIKKITVTDNVTNTSIVKQYQFGNGTLYKQPSYAVKYANEFFLDETVGGVTGFYGANGHMDRNTGALKQAQSIVPMQDADGAHIGYSTVTEILGSNGENGKTVYSYDQGIAQPENNSSKINPNIFIGTDYFAGHSVIPGIGNASQTMQLGNGLFKEIPLSTLYSNLATGINNNGSYYPSAPEQVDLTRGNLLQTQTYDVSGNLLRQVNNIYDTTVHRNYLIRGVKGFENSAPVFDNAIDDGLTYYILYTGICHLRYTANTDYESGSPITDTVKYFYESPYHTLATGTKTTRSNGDSVTQKTYYSFDYTPAATSDGVFGMMQQMNILAPVAKEVWENNTLTGSVVTAYGDFNTNASLGHVIKPSKIYMLANSVPLSISQAGETSTYTGQKTTLLPNNYFIERMDLNYDSVGRPLQTHKVNDKITSYQWAYGGAYPVVKSENAMNTFTTGDISQPKANINQFIASGSQQATQHFTFSLFPAGTIQLTIGYGGNPGTNPTYNVGYNITGPNSFNQNGTFCLGSGCPPQYLPTFVNYTNMPVGSYSVTMTPYSNVNTPNLPLNFTTNYSALTQTTFGTKEFFYEGFEENSSSNVQTGNAHTGNKYYNGSYPVPYTLPNSRNYLIQWWNYTTQWNFNQAPFTTAGMTLSGKTDDIRIFPVDAQITTYTYQPLIGISSELDPSGKATFYEYDSMRRLINIKDYQGNITNNFQYNYSQPCTSCALQMKTMAGTATPSYPVGVFSTAKKLLGNATTATQYISLWNADASNHVIGTLSAGSDSMHFTLTVNSGQIAPNCVTGCRYYQFDLPYTQIDAIKNSNGVYVDFGDGTGMYLGLVESDSNVVKAPNTVVNVQTNSSGAHIYWIHSYPNASTKTLTLYHNDDNKGMALDDAYAPATSLTLIRNIRGNLPQKTLTWEANCFQQSTAQSVSSISNWNSINSITTFIMYSGDLTSPCLHASYTQDFMTNNKNLSSIITDSYGLYHESNEDTTFKLSKLKSTWNKYFTNLTTLEICDADWNREDLTPLIHLNVVGIAAGNVLHSNNTTGNPLVPIPTSAIDNIINQVAGGAGLGVSNGILNILSGGTSRSSSSNPGITGLKAMGWTIIVNNVIQ
jgi:YD repeat-containing protein